MKSEQFKLLLKDMEYANMSNDYSILIKYIKDYQIITRVSNKEPISLLEIKEVIAREINLIDETITIEEIIKFLNLLGKRTDYQPFEVTSYYHIVNRIKNMTLIEQEKYAKEIIAGLKYTSPIAVGMCWQSFHPELQEKLLNETITMYQQFPNKVLKILYSTSQKVKEKIGFEKLKKILDMLESSDAINIINNLSQKQISESFTEIVQYIKDKNIDITATFIFETSDKNLTNIFADNVDNMIEIFFDDIDAIEKILEAYYIKTGTLFLRHFKKRPFTQDIEIAKKIKKKIIETAKTQKISVKQIILNCIEKNYATNCMLSLWWGDEELREQYSKEEKKSICIKLLNNELDIPIYETFSLDFFQNNINEILRQLMNNNPPSTIRHYIYELDPIIRENIEQDIINYCIDDELLESKLPLYEFYIYSPISFKEQFFHTIINDVMNNWDSYIKCNIKENKATVIKNIITINRKDICNDFTKDKWIEILELDYENFPYYYEYINEGFRNEMFVEYINKISLNDADTIQYKLSKFDYKIIKLNIVNILEKNNYNLSLGLFHMLKDTDITDEILLKVLEKNKTPITNSVKIQRYKKLLNINKNLNETIEPELLCDEIYNKISEQLIVRLTPYKDFQKQIIKYKNYPKILEIIQKIADNKENWLESLEYILNNSFDKLLQINNINDITEKQINLYLNYIMDYKNYFKISTLEDLKKYNDIKFNICLQILENTNGCKKLNDIQADIMYESPRIEQQKFALCEIMFGMSYLNVENLVKKYGKKIKSVSIEILTKEEADTIEILLQMIKIYELQNIDHLVRKIIENKKEVRLKMENLQNSVEIESVLNNIYNKAYKKEIYQLPSKKDRQEDVCIDNIIHQVDIINLKPEQSGYYNFKMIIRCEGAYSSWIEPDNFKDNINRPEITSHGNCKSLVANNLLAFPKSKGIIFGYCNNEIKLAAPWDIISANVNKNLSLLNSKWKTGKGIEFLFPNDMINYTRHNHNEIVSDRIVYQDKKIQKELPDYIVWINEPLEDDNDKIDVEDRWRMVKKASSQIGIPIVVLDKEQIIESEQKRIFDNLKQLYNLNYESNFEEIFTNIITNFENNTMSIKFNEYLKNKYFTDTDRQNLYIQIDNIINQYYETDPVIYYYCVSTIQELLDEEIKKTKTNTNQNAAKINPNIQALNKKYQSILLSKNSQNTRHKKN